MTTPLDTFHFFDHVFLVKREDRSDSLYNGNKRRKLHSLLTGQCGTPAKIFSCGGNQSNAMLALANAAKQLSIQFHYYTRKISSFLLSYPDGNFQKSILAGARIMESKSPCEEARNSAGTEDLFLPTGIAHPCAEQGIAMLAMEFVEQIGTSQPVGLYMAAGSFTTAFFLAKHLPDNFQLRIVSLAEKKIRSPFPDTPFSTERAEQIPLPFSFPFGSLHAAVPPMYNRLKKAGIEFDLLYDVPAWLALEHYRFPENETAVFLHGGGLEGNETMLARYQQ